jgi:hypothetical protein
VASFLLGGGQILIALLTDVVSMLGSALQSIEWETDAESHLSALLGQDTFLNDDPGEPLHLSFNVAFENLPISPSAILLPEISLAPSTHEESGVGISMALLLVTELIGRKAPPPRPSGSLLHARSTR